MVFEVLDELFFFGVVVVQICGQPAEVRKGMHKLVRDRFEVIMLWAVLVLVAGNPNAFLAGFVDAAAAADVWHLNRFDFLYFDRLAKHLDTCKMQPTHIYSTWGRAGEIPVRSSIPYSGLMG